MPEDLVGTASQLAAGTLTHLRRPAEDEGAVSKNPGIRVSNVTPETQAPSQVRPDIRTSDTTPRALTEAREAPPIRVTDTTPKALTEARERPPIRVTDTTPRALTEVRGNPGIRVSDAIPKVSNQATEVSISEVGRRLAEKREDDPGVDRLDSSVRPRLSAFPLARSAVDALSSQIRDEQSAAFLSQLLPERVTDLLRD